MRPDWLVSATGADPVPARALARGTYPAVTRPAVPRRTFLIRGTDQLRLAACAHAALANGHQVVLLPGGHAAVTPGGMLVDLSSRGVSAEPCAGGQARGGWDLAMFSSGSTTGQPRGYGFTAAQLATVTGWYRQIYQADEDTTIVTSLPAAYNFTFVAGVLLAASVGARLHFSASAGQVIQDAASLARRCGRVIILANPVVLDQATLPGSLPGRILADSGGAPLSTAAIASYREGGLDLREGWGLTETASLTHFDAEGSPASAGTVGTAMPGVTAAIIPAVGKPLVTVSSPAIGIPLDPSEPVHGSALATTDLGGVDARGRLRLLGRADDEQIGGCWPRDTLDALGKLLGRRCALIRHHAGQARIRLLTPASPALEDALRGTAAELLGIPSGLITVTDQGRTPLLHSAKLTRPDREPAHGSPPPG